MTTKWRKNEPPKIRSKRGCQQCLEVRWRGAGVGIPGPGGADGSPLRAPGQSQQTPLQVRVEGTEVGGREFRAETGHLDEDYKRGVRLPGPRPHFRCIFCRSRAREAQDPDASLVSGHAGEGGSKTPE